ncbi:hypothetical protein [Sphingorhabdus sp. EL138]|jgi:hypothetical protein|uniref:hypothetical protein n=1 Tax=Sphingorhabdus sp. EL138 TaxID=2073156 RepID=UPI0013A5B67C|nr:hypothetical protein [Sphingorhabdus sp. EL138]
MTKPITELENRQLIIHALDGILRELDDAGLHLAAVKIVEAREILMKIEGARDISSS